jgi:HK97 family phage major capsid protein
MPNQNRPYDFAGWATVNNVKCTDGRTIRRNAFIENDGETVPLVFQHQHNDPENVLGHCLLENRDEGVYCYGWFNRNPKAQATKESLGNGDLDALSIYANQLVQHGGDVVHGQIREVSIVLTGANKMARIENLTFAHSDGTYDTDDEEALIYPGEGSIVELSHGESDEEDEPMDFEEILAGMTDEQRAAVQAAYEQGQIDVMEAIDDEDDSEESDEDSEEIYDEEDEDFEDEDDEADDEDDDFDPEDYEDDEEEYEDDEEYDEALAQSMFGGNTMKRNVFEGDANVAQGNTLSHAETEAIFNDAKKSGSLRDSVLAHTAEYGIDQIDWLFPEYKNLNNPPEFIKRDTGWVSGVMAAVHHTPFSRIKSMFADITEDEARALGYIKGNRKKEEVFTLLKRTTDPQTIYKKQKLDRDDVIDITDFDVVAWIKGEMRMMLDEEIARAILIGDGRNPSSDDKIQDSHIRSIWKDDDLFSIKVPVTAEQGVPHAKSLIKRIIKARAQYRGSGNPNFYTTESVLTEMLLLEDGIGHFLYPTKQALATALRVNDIITVPVFEQAGTRSETVGSTTTEYDLLGIIVNLKDYNVGADKGGSVNMFDDFDIDYNQQKYLIETRCSGALVKPFSALVIEAAHTTPAFLDIEPSMKPKPWAKRGGSVYPQPEETTTETPDDGE